MEPSLYGMRLSIRHLRSRLFASTRLADRLKRSYRAAFAEAAGAGARRVGLFLVERAATGRLNVVDATFMLTTASYIPGDSSFELAMAGHLAAAGRSFVKPLRYDGDAVFPDFIVIDTDPHTYVEVYGIRGRVGYELRRRRRIRG
ncbi:DUF1173 family protein [Actinoallomurus sp. NPDC052274]|uniref:DUF1173 family protein n=1 Tax=Actinoallomurus sp. NPDC052274 TaxID=3155420 RepID=UPI00342C44D8